MNRPIARFWKIREGQGPGRKCINCDGEAVPNSPRCSDCVIRYDYALDQARRRREERSFICPKHGTEKTLDSTGKRHYCKLCASEVRAGLKHTKAPKPHGKVEHSNHTPIRWLEDYYTGSFRHQWQSTIQTLEAETFKETRRWHGQRKEPGRMPTPTPTAASDLCTSTGGKDGNQAGAE